MKSLTIILIVLLILGINTKNPEKEVKYEKEGNVIILDDTNFEDFLENRYVFVYFWEKNLKTNRFIQDFSEAAEYLKNVNTTINLAKVDYVKYKKLAEKYGVKRSNDYRLLRNGFMSEYDGKGLIYDLVKFNEQKIKKYMPQQIKYPEEFQKIKNETKGVFVFYFGNNPVKALAYERSSFLFEEFDFYVIQDLYTMSQIGEQPGTVVLYKPFDEKKTVFTEFITFEKLTKWLDIYGRPLLQTMDKRVSKEINDLNVPFVVLFQNDLSETPETKIMREVALEFRGKIKFAYASMREEEHDQTSRMIKINLVKKVPMVVINDKSSGKMIKYKLDKEITKDNIRQFVNDYFDKKLKVYLRSRPVPTEQTGYVKEVVGSNFKQEVLDNDKDVFVNFYADYCAHCKRLKKKWEELGEAMSDSKDLIIVKTEANENEYEGFEILEYPTLLLYKAGDKEHPIRYRGKRNLKRFSTFLNENCKHPVVMPEFVKRSDLEKEMEKSDL